MNVFQILKEKGTEIISVTGHTTALDAVRLFSQRRIGAAPVIEDGTLLGIVSERDVMHAVAEKGPGVLDSPVADMMTRGVVTCQSDDTLDKLLTIMTEKRFRHLPVMDGGKIVGFISIGDVVKERLRETEQEAEALKSYIATG